ncbi:thermonuclease family protein [Ochrobactrum quorumnocens]|jgi:endonuclease YncB( thermonuclease family)|uniref:Thermonuclease family protein n=1 Tax=Ochrobactrum quorumnocens TaxID=271865 RepID=A0A5N1JP56_9HYPH|nr:thermonuclease family protein [[Ochrobactrum] quorumnocens]KAA9361367.1 thermonuclease family protein [[Ochrobactrum] quorumnocens]MBD7993210.1 thermonuclease family protein [Ochrobactrum gallinarum]
MSNRRRYYRRPYQTGQRRRGGAFRSIFLTLLIFSALVAIIVSLPVNRQPKESLAGTVYVIDGDTVILNKVHIRLLGIDAPEMEQSCQTGERTYLCGREARNALRGRISGAAIRCEKEGIDKYGRDLGRCYLGETDLNRWMVEQGWAVSYGDYRSEEVVARREKLGLWAGSFEAPYQWRKEHQKPNVEAETGHEAPSSDAISDVINYIRGCVSALFNSLWSGAQ